MNATYTLETDTYTVEVDFLACFTHDSDYQGSFVDLDCLSIEEIRYIDSDGDEHLFTEDELETMVGCAQYAEIEDALDDRAHDEYGDHVRGQ